MRKWLGLIGGLALLSTAAHAENVLPMHVGGLTADAAAGGKTYQWPGIYFEARFSGPEVIVRFADDANNFNILIDGRNRMIVKKPGQTTITLDNLGAGPHSIRVEKRSETQHATSRFIGFAVPHEQDVLPAPNAPVRQIEFIGDSLTAGYGNTSAFGDCHGDDVFETTDTQEAFGPLIAKHYDADYRVEAYSGAGLVRNSGGRTPDFHITDLIERAVLDDPKSQDPSPWAPQIVVVNLGGNDFNSQLAAGEKWPDMTSLILDYRTRYVAVVKALRTRYPKAEILLSTTTDKIPFLPSLVDGVFADLKSDGVTGIDRLNWPAMQRTACDRHPNTRDDATIAQLYVDYIDHHPELWQGH
jgi:lysophospholipase L1-like esterase